MNPLENRNIELYLTRSTGMAIMRTLIRAA